MRPIKLKLNGFITYKGEAEIDFTKLYDKKIFIIAGDTGSGKTTIFDAISFALYGGVSRDISIDRLRSDYLNENDPPTYVNLTFEVDGKSYEIHRIPDHRATQKSRPRDFKHQAVLYDITDFESTGKKITLADKLRGKETVDDKVKEIIGLDRSQFTKVMLLAQGEFQQFLTAKSNERTILLGDIFKTDIYEEVQGKIKEKASESKTLKKELDISLEKEIEKNPDIREVIADEDLSLYKFSNMITAIDKMTDERKLSLSYEESQYGKAQESYEKLFADLKEKEQTNKNIENYRTSKLTYDQLMENREFYDGLKEDLDLSDYAHSLLLNENLVTKTKASIKVNKESLLKAKEDLTSILTSLDTNKEKIDRIDDDKKVLDKYKSEISEKNKTLEALNKFYKIKEEYLSISDLVADLEKLSKDQDTNKQGFDLLNKEIIDLDNKLLDKREVYQVMKKDLLDIEARIKDLDKELEAYKENQEIITDLNHLKTSKNELLEEKNLLDIEKNKYEENKRYIEINKFIDELNNTGICPVCMTHHSDHITKIETYDVDIESLLPKFEKVNVDLATISTEISLKEKAKKELRSLDDILKDKTNEDKSLNTKKEELSKIENEGKDLNKLSQNKKRQLAEDEKVINETSEKIAQLKTKAEKAENLRISYMSQKEEFEVIDEENLKNELANQIEEAKNLDLAINNTIEENTKLKTKEAQIKSNVENLTQSITKLTEDLSTYEADFTSKVSKKFKDYKEYKVYLDKYENLRSKKIEIDGYFDSLREIEFKLKDLEAYKDMDLIDLNEISSDIDLVKADISVLSQNIARLRQDINSYIDISQNIKDLEKSFDAINEETIILDRLSSIANGNYANIDDRRKIDFKTFVLTYYFDRVLAYANQRLYQMSNGQFLMERKTEDFSKQSSSGLDIEVFDAHKGKKRPATTLSGGESFLASLALALGLSDEISAENGGITIDTLFIDEGFGTLSDDYLDKVIEQIESLSNEDKLVGLISHVDELKEAIDAKILVEYDQAEGSNIRIIS